MRVYLSDDVKDNVQDNARVADTMHTHTDAHIKQCLNYRGNSYKQEETNDAQNWHSLFKTYIVCGC